jgi:hypothetical protein
MKLNRRMLFLVCLVATFALFAASTSAQTLGNRLPLPTAHAAVPADAAPAQPQQKSKGFHSDTYTCAYTFIAAGSNNSYMEFCVTANGNIVSLQSPDGVEYIYLGSVGEGYGICDFTSSDNYYDWAEGGISTNWNTPVVMSSSATSVKLERTTSDGIWTLTQTIAKETAVLPSAKVTMALKNNSATTRSVYLLRWADVDPYPASGGFSESADSTINSAWGYTDYDYIGDNYAGYGLMIQNIGIPTGTAGYSWGGFDLNTSAPPSPCSPTSSYYGYQANSDIAIEMLYYMEIASHKTATVNLRYMAF